MMRANVQRCQRPCSLSKGPSFVAPVSCAGARARRALCTSVVARLAPAAALGPCKPRRCRRLAAPGRASRQLAVTTKAMVNVDFASPSLVLGAILIGCGVLLLQMRNLQTRVSRDADIVIAAMISIVGSTLIFQGWRLDPLLLLCQALTTSVAVWYGIETFRLRSKEEELEEQQQAALPPGQANNAGWGPPPGSMQAPPQALPPQQQQQQPGSFQDWVGAFTGAAVQQQFMQQPGMQQQQQPLYPQQQQQQPMQPPPGGYLPAAQDQPYPWMTGASASQYGYQQQEMAAGQPMAVNNAAPWQQYAAGPAAAQWGQQQSADGGQYGPGPSQAAQYDYGMQAPMPGAGGEGADYPYGGAPDRSYGMYAPAPDAYQQGQSQEYGYTGGVDGSQGGYGQAAPAGYGAVEQQQQQPARAAQPASSGVGIMGQRVVEQIDDWE